MFERRHYNVLEIDVLVRSSVPIQAKCRAAFSADLNQGGQL